MAGKLKSIAVYCGHQTGDDPQFKRDARAVGRMLAKNGIRMVFGGGDVGLMGTVATAALTNNGKVIGVKFQKKMRVIEKITRVNCFMF